MVVNYRKSKEDFNAYLKRKDLADKFNDLFTDKERERSLKNNSIIKGAIVKLGEISRMVLVKK